MQTMASTEDLQWLKASNLQLCCMMEEANAEINRTLKKANQWKSRYHQLASQLQDTEAFTGTGAGKGDGLVPPSNPSTSASTSNNHGNSANIGGDPSTTSSLFNFSFWG